MIEFRDDFDRGDLDESVWFPHYLPAWSSRQLTRACYRVADSHLSLFIPTDRTLWCADEHPEPLPRVFPGWSTGADEHLVPSLDVDWVAGAAA